MEREGEALEYLRETHCESIHQYKGAIYQVVRMSRVTVIIHSMVEEVIGYSL